ncbi:hypothetical protein [Helicobacter sp. UBA3407]|nr:hypothetical protein [Helicobacter sp. UBA3407]
MTHFYPLVDYLLTNQYHTTLVLLFASLYAPNSAPLLPPHERAKILSLK